MTQQTMRWSSGDIAAAESALARAVPGEVTHVVTLTDEEVLVLDGLQHEQIVPLPWLEAQQGADRSLVGRVALRSLLARGLVVPAQRADGDAPALQDVAAGGGEVGIEAVPEVTGPLVLRRTGQAIVSAERTTTLGRHWVYLYLHEDDRVLEEEVAPSGHHAFSVYPVADVPERMAAFLDPAGTAVLDGRARGFSVEEFTEQAPSLPELAGAVAVTTLGGVHAGSDTIVQVTVYAAPGGVHVVRGTEHGPDGAPVRLELAEAGPKTVRRLPLELMGR